MPTNNDIGYNRLTSIAEGFKPFNAMLEVYAAYKSFWYKFANTQKTRSWMMGKDGLPNISGSPVYMHEGAVGNEYTNLINVPLLHQLGGKGVQGKRQLKGRERPINTFWSQQPVHFKRYAIELPHIADDQILNYLKMNKKYQMLLADWWAAYEDHDITRAIYEGFSFHITAPTEPNAEDGGGLGYTKRYNKNFYVWDQSSGTIDTNAPAFSFTSDTYKASIISALGGLTSSDKMSYDTIVAIGERALRDNIKPFRVDGEDVYVLVIHSLQELQLRQDDRFVTIQSRLASMKSPLFKNALGRIGNVIIVCNPNVARIAYANPTGSILDFFDYSGGLLGGSTSNLNAGDLTFRYPQNPGTNQHAACSFLVGGDAIQKACPMVRHPYMDKMMMTGTGGRLQYILEKDDYGAVKGLGTQQTFGYGRMDYYDQPVLTGDLNPTQQITPNSMVIATYV